MFGTKWPSITSIWMPSTPASSASFACWPSRAKSALRIEGSIEIRGFIPSGPWICKSTGTATCISLRERRSIRDMRRTLPWSGPGYNRLQKTRRIEGTSCASPESPRTLLLLESISPSGLRYRRPSVAWEAGESDRPTRIWLLQILCRGLRRSGPHPRARERVDGTVHRGSTSQREGPFLSQAEASPGRLQLLFLTSCCSSDSTTHPTGRAQSSIRQLLTRRPLPFLPKLLFLQDRSSRASW